MIHALLVGVLLVTQAQRTDSSATQAPRQIHLAFGDAEDSVVISWSTVQQTAGSCVAFHSAASPSDELLLACGRSEVFTDGGPKQLQQTLHRVTLPGLLPGTAYTYRCGSPGEAWSQPHTFTSKRQGAASFEQRPLSLLVYGDMGLDRALVSRCCPHLCAHDTGAQPPSPRRSWTTCWLTRRRTRTTRCCTWATTPVSLRARCCATFAGHAEQSGPADDLHSEDGQVGDGYMDMMQPVMASLPTLSAPGNHEAAYNFSHYRSVLT